MAIAAQIKAAIKHALDIPANQSTNGIHSPGCETMFFVSKSSSYSMRPNPETLCRRFKRLHRVEDGTACPLERKRS